MSAKFPWNCRTKRQKHDKFRRVKRPRYNETLENRKAERRFKLEGRA